MLILALDRAGNPSSWADQETAIHLMTTNRVLAPMGDESRIFYGGVNAVSGRRSSIEVSSILLTNAKVQSHLWSEDYKPPLTNRALFARDGYMCLYCGKSFSHWELTRDHVIPRCRNGKDQWQNVVSACRSCNHRKGSRTPNEWGVALLAVPYVPCYAEHMLLRNRAVLVDQMAFLKARVRHKD